MDDLRFYVLFNGVSVISGQWEVDNERLCAMELRLRLSRFRLERGSNSGIEDNSKIVFSSPEPKAPGELIV